jgi:hypothetical protein
MDRTIAICFALCLSTAAGLAQARPDKGERAWDDAPNQQRNADAQRRRAELRAAVQTPTGGPVPSTPGAVGAHQLSQQERKELRQQLRQQRQ